MRGGPAMGPAWDVGSVGAWRVLDLVLARMPAWRRVATRVALGRWRTLGAGGAGRILRRLLVPALIGTWRTSPCRLWLCPPPRETLNTEPSPATQSQSHCCTRGFRSWILRGASTTTHVASQLRRVAHAARQSTPCCWPTVTFEVVKVGTQPAVLPANCVRKGSNKAGYR